MAEKSVIIIGAGIAGLSAGIYGRMNGYQTQIFEMGIKPGGLCTAWERKGYIIDGCLHWLVGTSEKSGYHHLWEEVGALKDQQIIDLDQFMQVETAGGKTITFYTDADKLEQHLKSTAPEDSALIEDFIKAVKHFTSFDPPADKAPELYNAVEKAKMALAMTGYLSDFQKWGKLTIREFADRFQNADLKQAWLMVWPADFSVIFLVYTLAWMAAKNAGYLIGGSMQLALAMEKRYHELGGQVHYRSGVEKILVEKGRACGVKLTGGEEIKADYVISAADGHSTIYEMLEGKYTDSTIDGYYRMPIFQPLVYIGLGVNRPFTDFPQLISGLVFPLEKPLTIGKQSNPVMNVRIMNQDPSLADQGKTTLIVSFESSFDYWAELRQNPADYRAEKERIAVAVVSALNKRFPGLAREVEMWDVATPVTFYRYTGNWQGSFEGFLMTPQNMRLQMKKTLPGLQNFYMAGQWVQPGGGLPSALISGCHVIQILCHKDKKNFSASKA